MIRINLLPVKAAQKKEKLRSQLLVLAVCLLVAGGGCIGVYVTMLAKITAAKEDIVNKEAEIQRLQKIIGEVGRYKKLQQEVQGKLDVLNKLREGKTGPVHLLDELSKALPEKVWLTSFKESAGNVSITGIGANEEAVAQFLRNLETSPFYQNVELQVVEQVALDGNKLQKFDVVCKVEKPTKAL